MYFISNNRCWGNLAEFSHYIQTSIFIVLYVIVLLNRNRFRARVDHGNTIETATTLTLNTSMSGTIDPAGDVDYFSIVISTTRFVTIYTTGDGLEDTVGTLQNRTGTELADNDNPRGTPRCPLSNPRPP